MRQKTINCKQKYEIIKRKKSQSGQQVKMLQYQRPHAVPVSTKRNRSISAESLCCCSCRQLEGDEVSIKTNTLFYILIWLYLKNCTVFFMVVYSATFRSLLPRHRFSFFNIPYLQFSLVLFLPSPIIVLLSDNMKQDGKCCLRNYHNNSNKVLFVTFPIPKPLNNSRPKDHPETEK